MKPSNVLLPIIVFLTQASAFANGGAVQLRKEAGAFVITLFTAPGPVTAGPVDISVLLQNRNGLEPVLDADISLLLREETSGAQFQVRATREHARNKLLYAAPVTLGAPGKWHAAVTVLLRGARTEIDGVIYVAPTRAMVVSYWGYVALTPLMIAAFVVSGCLIRRKE